MDLDDDVAMRECMREIATYAHGVGPWKNSIVPDPYNPPARSALIEAAHAEGLLVHPYTFRSDVTDLPKTVRTVHMHMYESDHPLIE